MKRLGNSIYMIKKGLITLIGIVSMAIIFYSHQSINNAGTQEAIAVKKGSIEEKVIAVGNIVPKHTVSVKSTIPGIIGQLFREEGDYVNQGELLLQISPAPTPQNMAEIHAEVKERLAILQQAKEHQKRLEKLIKLKIETPDNYAMAVKDLAMAKAKLEVAQQKLALLQNGETTIGGKNIKTTITSPISGYILQRNVNVGDPVVPLTEAQEGTVLFVIANLEDLIFKGVVNEIDVAKITPKTLVNINIAALPDVKVEGILNKVGLQAKNQETSHDVNSSNSNNHNPFNVGFNVELNQLKLPKNIKLRSGYSATAEITIKSVKNVLILPERVLVFKENKIFVNLPNKNSKQVKQQEIKLGASDGMNVQITAGLSEGQMVLDNVVANS